MTRAMDFSSLRWQRRMSSRLRNPSGRPTGRFCKMSATSQGQQSPASSLRTPLAGRLSSSVRRITSRTLQTASTSNEHFLASDPPDPQGFLSQLSHIRPPQAAGTTFLWLPTTLRFVTAFQQFSASGVSMVLDRPCPSSCAQLPMGKGSCHLAHDPLSISFCWL